MDIVRIGANVAIFGSSIVAGKLLGATWVSSTFFVLTDIMFWVKASLFIRAGMPTEVPFLILARDVATSMVGYFAGLYLNRIQIPFDKKNSIKWTQAIVVHLVTIVVGVFIYGALMLQKELKLALKTTSL